MEGVFSGNRKWNGVVISEEIVLGQSDEPSRMPVL